MDFMPRSERKSLAAVDTKFKPFTFNIEYSLEDTAVQDHRLQDIIGGTLLA